MLFDPFVVGFNDVCMLFVRITTAQTDQQNNSLQYVKQSLHSLPA